MPPKIRLPLLGVLLVVFVAGIVQLFLLRFEVGDVYPPYSSLRSDPLGTKVFYTSLEQMGNLQIQRQFAGLGLLPSGRRSTLLLLGLDPRQLSFAPDTFYRNLERWMATGGRVVLAMRAAEKEEKTNQVGNDRRKAVKPVKNDRPADTAEAGSAGDTEDRSDSKEPPPCSGGQPAQASENGSSELKLHWGLILDAFPEALDHRKGLPADAPAQLLEGTVKWYSRLYVDTMPSNWVPILTVDERPVLIERRFKAGSIVFATDSYFISNEAMRVQRHPRLLAWLIGSRSKVFFDEHHLGVARSPGLAQLARRYNFYWFVAGAICIMGLFIWKNAHPFIPASSGNRPGQAFDVASEKDSVHGLTSLLRRNVPANRLLDVCIAEWKKANSNTGRIPESRKRAVDALLDRLVTAQSSDPVAVYREISSLLTEGKTPHAPKHRSSQTDHAAG